MEEGPSSLWGSFAGSFFEAVTSDEPDSIDKIQDETFTKQRVNPTIGVQPQKRIDATTQERLTKTSLEDEPHDANPKPNSLEYSHGTSKSTSAELLDDSTLPKTSDDSEFIFNIITQQCPVTDDEAPINQYFQKNNVLLHQSQTPLQSSDEKNTNLDVQFMDMSLGDDDDDNNLPAELISKDVSLIGRDDDWLQYESDKQVRTQSTATLPLSSEFQSLSDPLSASSVEDCEISVHHISNDDEHHQLNCETRADTSKNVIHHGNVELKVLQKQPCDLVVEKDAVLLVSPPGPSYDVTASKELNQLEDQKASSFISISSGSTTGESSSTLDESIGTLSLLSEKGLSTTTATPELFSDSTESFVPLGMCSSSGGEEIDDVNVHHYSQSLKPEISDSRVKPFSEDSISVSDGADSKTDLDVTLTEEIEEITENVGDLRKNEEISELSTLNETVVTTITTNNESNKLNSDLHEEKDVTSQSKSSLVSCMIEDAMNESVGMFAGTGTVMGRAHSPNSTTSSTSSNAERSDPVKTTESEQNSGHTSGDELETTTSSDIEIISSPSMGGESGCERSGSISPIKQSSVWRRTSGNPAASTTRYHGSSSSLRSYSPASDTSSTKDTQVGHLVTISVRPDLGFTTALGDKGNNVLFKLTGDCT